MKYCSHCGNEVMDEAVVCPKCGCQIENVAINKNTEKSSSQSNGMAVAGFVLSFFIPLLGLIFSILGFNKSKEMNDSGKGLSIAGIIISGIWLVGQVIYLIVAFGLLGASMIR